MLLLEAETSSSNWESSDSIIARIIFVLEELFFRSNSDVNPQAK